MNQPKVSVIIPVYNTEKYLRECLDSVVNQTLKDIEIICVDDGSTDGSLAILREYEAKDDRVKVLTQEKCNAGAARNVGLSKATGEYLAFLDSDDFYELFMLEHMLSCAQESMVDVVVCRFKAYYDNTGEIEDIAWSVKKGLLPEKKVFCYRDIERDCFQCIPGYNWDKLIKRALVVENGLRFQSQAVYNDALFTYTALISAKKVTFLDEALVFHRHRSAQNSIGDTRANYIDCSYTFLSGLKLFLLDIGKYDLYERDFINYVIHMFSVDLMSKGRDSTSEKAVKEKITLWLDEFHANEHALSYYYNLPEYEELLQQVFTRKSVHELEERKKPLLAAKSQTVIPIVYATDLGYMRYTLVSMVSALLTARRNTFYAFTVLVPQNSGIDQSDIDERLSHFDNYSLSFIEMGNEFADLHMHIPHITSPTFYRLRITSLLENFDKCIYLDGDTIVCEDLQGLFSIDMQDNYLCGVPAFIYYVDVAKHKERLGISEDLSFQYINAGVALFNLEKLREDDKESQFIQLLDKNYESQDQDILNMACYGRIQLLPYRYNVMTKYAKWKLSAFPSEAIPYEIVSGRMYPAIIHYADKVKPWKDYSSPYSNLWFSAAMTDICWDLFSDISILKNPQSGTNVTRKKRKFIPSKVHGVFQCFRDHGAGYTVRRILYHIGLWEDEEAPKGPENRPKLILRAECSLPSGNIFLEGRGKKGK